VSNLLDIVGNFALQNPAWIKIIISAGILLQGELTTLIATHLIVESYLPWSQFLSAAIPALLIGETALYMIGRFIRNTRFGWRMERKFKDNRRIQFYTRFLHRNASRLFVIAKFIIGANFLVLLLAGWTKMRFRPFLRAYLKSAAFWFVTVIAVSYGITSGLHYLKSENIFRKVELIILGIIILFFIGEHFFKVIIRKEANIEAVAEKIGSGEKEET